MKRLACWVVLAACPANLFAAFGDVKEVVENSNEASASLPATYSVATPVANDLNIAHCFVGDGPAAIDTSGFTDDLLLTDAGNDDGGLIGSQLVTGGSDNTVTCSQATGDEIIVILTLIEGAFASSPADVSDDSGATTADPVATGASAGNTAQADEYMTAIETIRDPTDVTADWDRQGTATPTTDMTEYTGGGIATTFKRLEAAGQVLTAVGTVGVSRANAASSAVMLGYVTYKKASSATFDQEGFAFGDDNGNEASHTLGTQDANFTGELGTKTLRTLMNLTGTGSSVTPSLRFQKNGAGGYAAVSTTSVIPQYTGAIEVGDATNSGNNTASTVWSISTPDAVAGDLILVNLGWDDSTTTTDVQISSGKNGETPQNILGPIASGATAVRSKAWYFKATGSWTAGTIISTPSASEQWTATVIKVPSGEFDPTTPVGVTGSSVSAGGGNPWTAAMTAGSTDGGGRVVAWVVGDVDDPDGSITDWTEAASVDRGAVGANFQVRTTTVTDSEVIAAQSGLTFPSADQWATIGYIVRPPADVTNEVYISASGNVTAGGEATTARLAAPSGKTTSDFDTGRRWDDENGSDAVTLGDDEYSEFEWILTTQSPATTDDYFEFRTYIDGAAASSYSVTPKWTIGTAAAGGEPPAIRRVIITSD